jgi:integrase/recombinase XerD
LVTNLVPCLPMILLRGHTYYLRLMHHGKLYHRSLHTSNRNEALKLEAAFRTSLLRGEFGIIDGQRSPTLKDFKDRLLQHLKNQVSPRTYTFYKENLSALIKFEPLANTKLARIQADTIEKFIQWRLKPDEDGKKRSVATVNHSLRTLRRALLLAKEWKLIHESPKIKLLVGENQRECVLSEGDMTAMVEASITMHPKSTFQWLLPFLVDTGLRISECCNLKRDDLTLEGPHPVLKVAKGKSKYARREVPLTKRALYCVREALVHSKSYTWVWTGRDGKTQMTRHYPSELFRTMRDAANVDKKCVLHSTRHSFCTRLGNAGASALDIQRLAGHSSLQQSMRYTHPDMESKRTAISLLDALNPPQPEHEGIVLPE